jgi:hypothetical protein
MDTTGMMPPTILMDIIIWDKNNGGIPVTGLSAGLLLFYLLFT